MLVDIVLPLVAIGATVWTGIHVNWFFSTIGCISVLLYAIPVLAKRRYEEQNLRDKYNARWAIVTGSSSGIGLALSHRLASQGLNLILIAKPDAFLESARKELSETYPNVDIKSVPVDLTQNDPSSLLSSLDAIARDIPVSMLFNNAGYILPGLFQASSLHQQLANMHCNATSAVALSHWFTSQYTRHHLRKGLIVFTSSSAGFLPTPMSGMYGATKSFLTSFASSLSGDVYPMGIDVSVVHPSPVNSRFYESTSSKMAMLSTFQKTSVGPDHLASVMLKHAGRSVVVDQGYFSYLSKMVLKGIDWNWLAEVIPYAMRTNADFQRMWSEYSATTKQEHLSASLKESKEE